MNSFVLCIVAERFLTFQLNLSSLQTGLADSSVHFISFDVMLDPYITDTAVAQAGMGFGSSDQESDSVHCRNLLWASLGPRIMWALKDVLLAW